MRVAAVLLLAVVAGLAPATAHAQDVAASEAQFERGLAAMEKGDYAIACPAIEESYRLDPRAGTMFTLAECENKRGRTATAATRYEDYLSFHARLPPDLQQRQGDRPHLAASQRDALRARAPRLTLVVPSALPPGSRVSRDGIALAAPSWGIALPVDPGEHVVRLEAPGHAPSEIAVSIVDGEARSVVLQLGPATAAPPPPPAAASPAVASPAEAGLTPAQTSGLVLVGVGVVGLGLGAGFGIATLSEKSTIDRVCGRVADDGTRLCDDASGTDAAASAATTGTISTVSFGVGAAAAVGGVLLIVLGGDEDRGAAGVRPLLAGSGDGAFAGARGRF